METSQTDLPRSQPEERSQPKGRWQSERSGGAVRLGWTLWARNVAWVHGIYYLLMGLWPVLNIDSFLMATGPKSDIWLVNTVGLMLIVCGLVLLLAAYRRQIRLEIALLAIGMALTLLVIEMIYVIHGTISAVYVVDALIQGALIAGWLSRGERFA